MLQFLLLSIREAATSECSADLKSTKSLHAGLILCPSVLVIAGADNGNSPRKMPNIK